MRLPADYVATHVELGYAVTTARSQGLTVDESHTIATPGMARGDLYVALTRGRDHNHLYVATDQEGEDCRPPVLDTDARSLAAREVLDQILATSHAELSATETWTAFHPLDRASVPPPGRPNAQSPRYIAQLEDAGLLLRPRPAPTFTHTPPAPSPGYGRDAIGR
ncbi:MAG: hypothetical protein ACYC1Z_06410 [Georgenia sp.]